MLLILMFQTLPVLAIRAPSATRHSYLVILRRLGHSILSCGILCCFVWLMGQFWPPVSIKLLLLLLLLLLFTFDKYSALVDSNDGPKMVLHIEGNHLVHLHTSQLCLCLRTLYSTERNNRPFRFRGSLDIIYRDNSCFTTGAFFINMD